MSAMPEPARGSIRSHVQGWLAGVPLPGDVAVVYGLVLPALLLAFNLWHLRAFTVDDAFISFRYARNLARGLGLVYNEGARVEGYTNFLFTLLLAGGIKLGLDPEALAKGIGAVSALGSLGVTYALAGRMAPYRSLPCVATWLLASSVVFTGWSVFGLETALFVFLVLLGTYLFLVESLVESDLGPEVPVHPASAWPWSGVAFAAAGLTRPEAPMFVALLMLVLGRRIASRQNFLRAAIVVGPLLLHEAFRRAYYGAWLPNTFGAKTGDLGGQLESGAAYVRDYLAQAGPVLYLGFLGVAAAVVGRRRDLLAMGLLAAGVVAYVVLVGGDWMAHFRPMAPFEPFAFLLVDVGVRRAFDGRDAVTRLALVLFAAFVVVPLRRENLRDARIDVQNQKRFWETAAGGTARWLSAHPRGEIAMGDIGYVGWATDYPILDLLGLVDPVIARLPGGYTKKFGPGFADRLFEKQSRYVLIISSDLDCRHPSVPGSRTLWDDPRFEAHYALGGQVPLDGGFAWCLFERHAE